MAAWIASAALIVVAATLACAQPEMPAPVDGLIRATLSAGDITVVVGNHADHGAGKTGYIGLHSLTHIAEGTNLFVPRYAGIITSRSQASIVRDGATGAWLQHSYDGSPSQLIHYTVAPPHYVDLEIARTSGGAGFWLNSASYMNGPTDRHIYFLDIDGQWQKHFDPEHGNAASVYPHGMALPTLQKVADATF